MKGLMLAAAICASLFLAGCGESREDELKRLWAAAVEEDTFQSFIRFLSVQKREEDTVVEGVSPYPPDHYYRRLVAVGRIFELATKGVRGKCPFETLYVDLKQNIKDVPQKFSFHAAEFDEALETIGVDLEREKAPGAETLVVVLNGRGVLSDFVFQEQGTSRVVRMVSGGRIEGEMWLASRPEGRQTFSGESAGPVVASEFDAEHKDERFPKGLVWALREAKFDRKFAALMLDACGPAASALIYFNQRILNNKNPESADPDLEERFRTSLDEIWPVVAAAGLGAGSYDKIQGFPFYRSEKAARFLLAVERPENAQYARAWAHTHNSVNLPDWFPVTDETQ